MKLALRAFVATVSVLIAAPVPVPAIAVDLTPPLNTIVGRDVRHPDQSTAGKKVKKVVKKAQQQAHTNNRHLRRKVKKEWDHTRRWVSEDTCDREVRKKRYKNKEECRATIRANNTAVNAPSQPRFAATAVVDCWKPGRDTRWGQSYQSDTSQISLNDARRKVLATIEAGNVCRDHWRDATLYTPPGAYKWLEE